MIKFFRIQNFKSLRNAAFPLASLNLLTGLNGMGKSSLIQALLLLRQSHEKNTLLKKGLLLKGDYLSLGTGIDVLSESAENDQINFTLAWNPDSPTHFSFKAPISANLLPYGEKDPPKRISYRNQSLFSENFLYLSAERISPRSNYEASTYHIDDLNSLGNQGEYTPHYISKNGQKDLKIRALIHPEAKSKNLLTNINQWMSAISTQIGIRTKFDFETNTVLLSYTYPQKTGSTVNFKPQNVGFGITFALPVVTAILRSQPGDMIIIENPEAHLHPAGQSLIGKMCAIAANAGVQVIAETHSDHFLNGVRVAVRQKVIPAHEVQIFFLERDQSNEHESRIVNPTIDENGRLDYWPEGFFDEGDRLLEKLLL